MLIKILCLAFETATGIFNERELRDFLKDVEIISVRDYFFVRNEIPYLVLVIKYFPFRQEHEASMAPQGKRDESWREELSACDMGLFNLLRDWRSQRCKKEGVPPYVLFTNRQLTEIVKIRPQSLAELQKIDGVGKAKIEKYGSDLLAITSVDLGSEKTASKTEDSNAK